MSLHRKKERGNWHSVVGNVWKSTKTTNYKRAVEIQAARILEEKPSPDGRATEIPWKRFIELYELNHSGVEKRESTRTRELPTFNLFQRKTGVKFSTDFSPKVLQEFKVGRSGKVVNRTINRNIGPLRDLARWGQKEGYIPKEWDFDAVELLGVVKKSRVFFEMASVADFEEIVKTKPLRVRLIYIAGRDSGMRTDELRHLKPRFFDFHHDLIRLRSEVGWAPKNGKERDIPLFEEFKAVLLEWVAYMKIEPNDYIFVHDRDHGKAKRGQRMGRDMFRRTLKELIGEAGLSEGTFYSLRHTYATHMADKIPLHVLQEILGHDRIETTRGYIHLRQAAIKDAAKKSPFTARNLRKFLRKKK